MQITSANIQLSHQHIYRSTLEQNESLRMSRAGDDGQQSLMMERSLRQETLEASATSLSASFGSGSLLGGESEGGFDPSSLLQGLQAMLNLGLGSDNRNRPELPPTASPTAVENVNKVKDDENLSPGLQLIKLMVEMITGEAIDTIDPSEIAGEADNNTVAATPSPAAPTEGGEELPGLRAGMEYNYSETYTEYEYSSFSMSASLTTADGQQIEIEFSLEQERFFSSSSSVSLSVGEPVDPIVLSSPGSTVALDDDTFEFDLDNDGELESINQLGGNSSFLALDRNGDGEINNGSELFGPATGNGFAELAAYDQDGNGFIDAGDAIFSQLSLFRPGGELQSLLDAQIGAIALQTRDTPFTHKDEENNPLAETRASSFYVTEDGKAGVASQIDYFA